MSLRTGLIVALALLFGGTAALGVHLYARSGGPRPDLVPVVVAAKPVPRGGMLTPDQVKVADWPKNLVPPGAVTKVDDAVGRVVYSQVVKDEPLLESKLGAKNGKGGLAPLVPPGMRAFTILTPNVSAGVAGFILPGNKVDVLLTLNGDQHTGGGVTTTLLQNVEILAVDTRLEAPNENKVDPHQLQSVTLLVNPDQAAMLDLGQNKGVLHLSLRSPEDTHDARPRPATLNALQFHQEKPWIEHLKDMIEIASRTREKKAEEAAKTSAAAAASADPPPPLEIRTLRGRYPGVVQISSLEQETGGR